MGRYRARVRLTLLAAGVVLCALVASAIAEEWGSAAPGARPHRGETRRKAGVSDTAANASPLAGTKWYVDPHSDAAAQVEKWRRSHPAAAAELAKIAAQPTADWFGGRDSGISGLVRARVQAATAAGSQAQLVAYDIPGRDCGGYSSGGATSASGYRRWIRSFAAGIGSHSAIVILEPDALAGLGCLSSEDQAVRLSLLGDAVSVLRSHAGVHVYLDAGHAGWRSAAEMARRLRAAGIAQAQGFSVNVANYKANGGEVAYGHAIAALIDGKHFVIDTSRNGNGSDGQSCNPRGRALGTLPTATTGDALLDAFLWIKTPGRSDGTCNGGPAAGTWWPSYALRLAQNAARRNLVR